MALKPELWTGRIHLPVREIISQEYPNSHSDPLIYRKLSAPLTSKCLNNSAEIFWSYTSKYGRIKHFLAPQIRALGRDKVLGSVLKEYFSPPSKVMESVNELLSGRENKTLGVHVRYTDLKVPLERLVEKVKVELSKFEYRSIFLATDSRHAEEIFRHKFDNVVTHAKRYSNNNMQLHRVSTKSRSVDDAFSALIDMFALSRCAGLVYCSRSTFSETSRLLGSFDSSRLVDVDKHNLLVRAKRVLQDYL